MLKQILSEFIGTFILVLAILLSGKPLFIAAGFLVAIAMIGPLSGGHINPAVSFVMAIKGDLPWSSLAHYVVAQIAGALLALAVFRTVKAKSV